MMRIGFWGPSYYSYNKEAPNSIGNLGPYITSVGLLVLALFASAGCVRQDKLPGSGNTFWFAPAKGSPE